MGAKTPDLPSTSTIERKEADELRLAVRELNQSVAYLSKMVVQLQRSLVGNKEGGSKPPAEKAEKPETMH